MKTAPHNKGGETPLRGAGIFALFSSFFYHQTAIMASKGPGSIRTCGTCKAVFTTIESSEAHIKELWNTGACPPPPNHILADSSSSSGPSFPGAKEDESSSESDEKGVNKAWPDPVRTHAAHGTKIFQMAQKRYANVSAPLIIDSDDNISAPASDDDVDVSHAEKTGKRQAHKKPQKDEDDVKRPAREFVCAQCTAAYVYKRSLNDHIKKKHSTVASEPMAGFESVDDEDRNEPMQTGEPNGYEDVDMLAPVTLHDEMTSPNKRPRTTSFSLAAGPSPKKPRLDESVPMHIRHLLDTPSPSAFRQHLAQTIPALTFNQFMAEVLAIFKNPVARNYQPKDTVPVEWMALNEMIAKLKWFMDQQLVLSTLMEATVRDAFNGDPIVVNKLHMLTAELVPMLTAFVEWRSTAALYAHEARVPLGALIHALEGIGKTDTHLLAKSAKQFSAWQKIVAQTMDHISLLMDVFHTGGFPKTNNDLAHEILARKDMQRLYVTAKCPRCTRVVAVAYEKVCIECTLKETPDPPITADAPPTEHDWYMHLAAGLDKPKKKK